MKHTSHNLPLNYHFITTSHPLLTTTLGNYIHSFTRPWRSYPFDVLNVPWQLEVLGVLPLGQSHDDPKDALGSVTSSIGGCVGDLVASKSELGSTQVTTGN